MSFDVESAIEIIAKEVSTYQVPVVDLIQAQTEEPWKILVATILSARTKDEVTAVVADRLFKKFKTLHEIAELPEDKLAKLLHPVGFFRNKAKYLRQLPIAIDELYNGVIPDTVDELVKLPGVGRKTANLVVAVAFKKPAICVDTHVHRICNIWGYVKTSNPLQTEMQLRKKLPEKYWLKVNRVLVAFGQSICRPIAAQCDRCPLNASCPKIGAKIRKNTNSSKRIEKQGLKLLSWNVNGIRAVAKKGFKEFLESENPDIIGLQETKAQLEQLSSEITDIGDYKSYFHSAERKGYSGVAVYSKIEPIQIMNGINEVSIDAEGRVLTLEFEHFFFITAYFPNSQEELKRIEFKELFFEKISDWCDNLKQRKPVILCGDYNVAHKAIDLARPKPNENNPGYSLQERNCMDDFIARGYVDTFRMFEQGEDFYSWWSYRFQARQKNIGWRIDYFCVNQEARASVQDAQILNEVLGSDHCPVALWWKPLA